MDLIGLIIGIPIVLSIACFVGSVSRSMLIKDEYKQNTAAIIINIIIGIITLIILAKATR